MDTIKEAQPPHSVEAEEAVVGSLLIDPDAMTDVIHILPDERAFYRYETRAIYGAMKRLWKRGAPTDDVVLIMDELRGDTGFNKVDDDYLYTTLLLAVPTSINAEYYASIVADHYTRRQVLVAAGRIASAAYNESMPVSEVLSLARRETVSVYSVGDNTVQDAPDIGEQFLNQFLNDAENGVPADAVILTGLTDFDRKVGGLQKPFTHVLMGRPGHMKSGFSIKAMLATARSGQRVLFLSLEMTVEQLVGRMVSQMCDLSYESIQRINRSKLSAEDRAKVARAVAEFRQLPIHIDETPALSPSQMQARIDRLCAVHEVDLVIIDHVHLAKPDKPSGNEVIELKDIITEVTAIGKRYGCAMLVLAQMNRKIEERQKPIPQMSDINGSGAIEAAASTVTGIVWPAKFDPNCIDTHRIELWIVKNRDGATGMVVGYVKPETMAIENAVIDDLNHY